MKGFGSKNKIEKKKEKNFFEKDGLLNYALEMHQKGKISEAKGCYQKIIKRGNADARVYTNLGVIFQTGKTIRQQ